MEKRFIKLLFLNIIFILTVFYAQLSLAQQGQLADFDEFGPDYLKVEGDVRKEKIDDSVLDGIGQKEDFIGVWDIGSMGIKNYIGGVRSDKFLDLKDAADFQPDGNVLFWERTKSQQMNTITRKYKIKDGVLLLYGDDTQVELKFGFLQDSGKLILKSENITMILTKK